MLSWNTHKICRTNESKCYPSRRRRFTLRRSKLYYWSRSQKLNIVNPSVNAWPPITPDYKEWAWVLENIITFMIRSVSDDWVLRLPKVRVLVQLLMKLQRVPSSFIWSLLVTTPNGSGRSDGAGRLTGCPTLALNSYPIQFRMVGGCRCCGCRCPKRGKVKCKFTICALHVVRQA